MKRIFLISGFVFFLFGLSFISCTKKDDQLIEREKFVKILTDLQLAEGIMTSKGLFDGSLDGPDKSYYNFVLKKHNISRSQFDYSLEYYNSHLNELGSIFDEVIENLNKKVVKKLSPNSIYIIADKVRDEAQKIVDPTLRFGAAGMELWQQKNVFNFPADTSRALLKINKELKHQSLLVFRAEYKALSKNKTSNPVMRFVINYADSTADSLSKKITFKTSDWEEFNIVHKTDSLKKPTRIISSVIDTGSINNQTFIFIRSISLKQYARTKDTSGLFVKPSNSKIKKRISKPLIQGSKVE